MKIKKLLHAFSPGKKVVRKLKFVEEKENFSPKKFSENFIGSLKLNFYKTGQFENLDSFLRDSVENLKKIQKIELQNK